MLVEKKIKSNYTLQFQDKNTPETQQCNTLLKVSLKRNTNAFKQTNKKDSCVVPFWLWRRPFEYNTLLQQDAEPCWITVTQAKKWAGRNMWFYITLTLHDVAMNTSVRHSELHAQLHFSWEKKNRDQAVLRLQIITGISIFRDIPWRTRHWYYGT